MQRRSAWGSPTERSQVFRAEGRQRSVKALNPRIVMCSLSAFVQTGPLANEPGFDTLGAAYAGITSMGGEADGPRYVPQAAIAMSAPALTPPWRFARRCFIAGARAAGQYLDVSRTPALMPWYRDILPAIDPESATGGSPQGDRDRQRTVRRRLRVDANEVVGDEGSVVAVVTLPARFPNTPYESGSTSLSFWSVDLSEVRGTIGHLWIWESLIVSLL
jgi:hypothetical protein